MDRNEALRLDEADILSGGELLPSRLGAAVIERLTQAILDGRLKPGDALPSEGRIAAAFGVSKPVAREALREMAAMGIIHIQQGKVARVRDLDHEPLGRFYRFAVGGSEAGLAEAIELRRILEPAIARLAALRRDEANLAALKSALGRMEACLGDIPVWIEADLDFHEAVAASAHNRLLQMQMRGLRPVIREITTLFNARRTMAMADWRQTYQRHERIVAAIEAGSPEAAASSMTRHFEAADAAIQEIFHGRPGPPAAPGTG